MNMENKENIAPRRGRPPLVPQDLIIEAITERKTDVFKPGSDMVVSKNSQVWVEISEKLGNALKPKTIYNFIVENKKNIKDALLDRVQPRQPHDADSDTSNEGASKTSEAEESSDDVQKFLMPLAKKKITDLLVEKTGKRTELNRQKEYVRVYTGLKPGLWQDYILRALWDTKRTECSFKFKCPKISKDGSSGKILGTCKCQSTLHVKWINGRETDDSDDVIQAECELLPGNGECTKRYLREPMGRTSAEELDAKIDDTPIIDEEVIGESENKTNNAITDSPDEDEITDSSDEDKITDSPDGDETSGKARTIPMLKNGNDLTLRSIKLGNQYVSVSNTCAFDSLLSVLLGILYDHDEYNEKFIKFDNKLSKLVSHIFEHGVTAQAYKQRAEILFEWWLPMHESIKEQKHVTMDCIANVAQLANTLLKGIPSITETSICSDCKHERKKVLSTLSVPQRVLRDGTFEDIIRDHIITRGKTSCYICKARNVATTFEIGDFINLEFFDINTRDCWIQLNEIPKLILDPKGGRPFQLKGIVDFTPPSTRGTRRNADCNKKVPPPGHYTAACIRSTGIWMLHDDLKPKSEVVPENRKVNLGLATYFRKS